MVVLSLITPVETFRAGVEQICSVLDAENLIRYPGR
jgi:hypothetical protein